MPATRSELRERARRRADMENSDFVSDEEWNVYLNEGLAELHEIVVGKHEDFLVSSTTVSISAGTSQYSLPSDFLAVRGVDLVSGSNSYTLEPFMFRERNRYTWLTDTITPGGGYMYQVVGDYLRIVPSPSGSGTLTLWYIPQASQLNDDADMLDVAYANGWERYIVLYAAIRALQKEESDISQVMPELMTLQQKIEANAARTSADPKRVVDVRYQRELWW